jgi:hypothetical protein
VIAVASAIYVLAFGLTMERPSALTTRPPETLRGRAVEN